MSGGVSKAQVLADLQCVRSDLNRLGAAVNAVWPEDEEAEELAEKLHGCSFVVSCFVLEKTSP